MELRSVLRVMEPCHFSRWPPRDGQRVRETVWVVRHSRLGPQFSSRSESGSECQQSTGASRCRETRQRHGPAVKSHQSLARLSCGCRDSG